MRSDRYESQKSKFQALEGHLLNTFFSGLYISASELIEVAKKVNIDLGMNTRELLIKELLNTSSDNGTLLQVIALLNTIVNERINEYHQLSMNYPHSNSKMALLASRANATKALLARESRGNPYE